MLVLFGVVISFVWVALCLLVVFIWFVGCLSFVVYKLSLSVVAGVACLRVCGWVWFLRFGRCLVASSVVLFIWCFGWIWVVYVCCVDLPCCLNFKLCCLFGCFGCFGVRVVGLLCVLFVWCC